MPIPTCTLTVSYLGPPADSFFFFCTSHSPTWHLDADGTIRPPTRSRVIQMHPGDPAGVKLVGIRLATDPDQVRNTNENYFNDTDIKVALPTADDPTITLEDLPASRPARLWYAVGLELPDGSVKWDDPKIYNPPDR